jgi:hypothetical protein
MRPLTEGDIRSSFVNATPEQLNRLPLPGLHETLWDEREFLGWLDPQAARLGYIALWLNDRPVGMVVRASSGSLRHGIAAMCSFCHSMQPATHVLLFSAPRAGASGRHGNTIGSYICDDLDCSRLIRLAPPRQDQAGFVHARAAALEARVQRFTADLMSTA